MQLNFSDRPNTEKAEPDDPGSGRTVEVERRIPGLDLDKIAESGQCFRWQRLAENSYRIPHEGNCLSIRMTGPEIFSMNCTEEEFESCWRSYFDLDTDYEEINSRIDPETDPFLYEAMKNQSGIRILRQNLWEMIITCIITQNRNIPAIQRSAELLSACGGERKTDPSGNAFHTFPTAVQIAAMREPDLSRCRLGYRERYVRGAAEAVCSGAFNPDALDSVPDQACREKLTELCGVGDKVAACIMLFGMHRLNAFPRDVWINRVLEEKYPGGFPFRQYEPYNGVYQQYLFAYYRNLKTKEA